MPGSLSTKLALYLPDGPDFVQRVQDFIDNWNKLDAAAGALICTSGTRPVAPFAGQVIFETDTDIARVWNSTDSRWDALGIIKCTSGTRPASPLAGDIIYETNTFNLLYRRSGAWVEILTASSPVNARGWIAENDGGPVTSFSTDTPSSWTASSSVAFTAGRKYKVTCSGRLKNTGTAGDNIGMRVDFDVPGTVFAIYANIANRFDSARDTFEYSRLITATGNHTVRMRVTRTSAVADSEATLQECNWYIEDVGPA